MSSCHVCNTVCNHFFRLYYLFFITLIVLKSTSQIFCKGSLDLGLSGVLFAGVFRAGRGVCDSSDKKVETKMIKMNLGVR